MRSRISITLLIAMIGAAVAIAALFLPARNTLPSAEYGPATNISEPTGDQSGDTAGESAAAPVDVAIANFSFTSTAPLQPGQIVVVTNNDSAPHTLTADDGSFDTGLLQPGEQASIVMPSQSGEFSFFCEVHPSMTGTFSVSA